MQQNIKLIFETLIRLIFFKFCWKLRGFEFVRVSLFLQHCLVCIWPYYYF